MYDSILMGGRKMIIGLKMKIDEAKLIPLCRLWSLLGAATLVVLVNGH